MTDKVADAKRLFFLKQERAFPGHNAKVAEFTQAYGDPDTEEVVRMMVIWAAVNPAPSGTAG